MKVELVPNFLNAVVEQTIKKKYGDNFFIKGNRVLHLFKTYPYPKDIGYWFVKDDDLYVVIDDH